jgi:lipopolysaccharide biosynthesis glycosyltransferase
LWSRQVPTEDKSSQAQIANFDRAEAGYVAERADSADTVHVACCFDQKMELPFLVLASSLNRHLKGDRRVVLHAFHSDPIAHDLAYFVGLNSATFELRLRQIENQFHRPVTWPSHLTAATLLRLLLPLVLKDIDRVVYLDCDLVVLNDITTLYDTDLLDFPLAACLDFWLTGGPPFAPPIVGWGIEDWQKFLRDVVRLADRKAYFNAGVLVMDLKRFRNTGLFHAAEEFLEQTNYKTVYVDQDALNHVANGAFVRLDSRWNVLASRRETDRNNADCENAASAPSSDSEPWIIHYAGPYKQLRGAAVLILESAVLAGGRGIRGAAAPGAGLSGNVRSARIDQAAARGCPFVQRQAATAQARHYRTRGKIPIFCRGGTGQRGNRPGS